MKTKQLIIMILGLFLAPLFTRAQDQSPIEKVYAKYAGQDNFTSVNINKELFKMLQQMEVSEKSSEDMKEMQSIMEQIDGLKIITYNDSLNSAKISALYKEFNALFPSSLYQELMVVQEKGNTIRFLTKQDSGGKVLELVMLQEDDDQVTLLSLVGHIDLKTISKLSENMNIHGMKNLEKIKENPPKK